MNTKIKDFFDQQAGTWDEREIKSQTWLYDFIKQHIPLEMGMKVLDLGCGTGIVSEIIYQLTKTKVTALDVSSCMIDKAKQKHHLDHIDFYNEDFYKTDKTGFDMILCYNAYPHFIDVEGFNNKAYKVLNEQGYLVIIHSMSRDRLTQHHERLSEGLARVLRPVKEEVKTYYNNFEVVELIDSDQQYMILLKRKEES